MAIIGDAQSCNVLIAEPTFRINDRYSLIGMDEETINQQLRNQRDPEKCRAKDVAPVDNPGAVLRTVVTKWAKENNVTIPKGI